jgi:ribonuclease HII
MQDFEKIIIDGNKIPSQLEHLNCQAIIKGDNQFYEIAAASIIAKVTRDELMIEYSKQHPDYDWHNNFGYGTLKHLEAIEKIGITEHHRRSFAPIKNLL